MFKKILLQKIEELLSGEVKTRFKRGGHFLELNGHYECDCSGLINSLLFMCSKDLYIKIKGDLEALKAVDYFNIATDSSLPINWHQRIDLLCGGECLVWRKQQIPKSGDSGHIAIVLDRPKEVKKGLWSVKVFDCSKIPHDEDSRQNEATGIGVGTMFLLVRDNIIEGYIWSSELKKNKRIEIRCISFS